jgi:hypothetical protein
MFFRQWRARRREAVARQRMAELVGLKLTFGPALATGDAAPIVRGWEALTSVRAQNVTPALDGDAGSARTFQRMEERMERMEAAMLDHRRHINFLEAQRIRGIRQFAAAQSLLESFIRTHQRPDLLRRWWHQEIPKLIDEVTEVSPDLPDEYQEEALAWQAMVKRYTYLIEATAAHYERQHEADDD